MSFADRFKARWENVFVPAIEGEPFNEKRFRAVRVDTRRSGDSILTEIADGIAHAQVVIGDVSVVDRWKDSGDRERHARNSNVMYEIGLALAWRQPVDAYWCAMIQELSCSTSLPFQCFTLRRRT